MNIHPGTLAGVAMALAIAILLAVNSLTAPDAGCITDTECGRIDCLAVTND